MAAESKAAVMAALLGKGSLAVLKGVAAAFTGSRDARKPFEAPLPTIQSVMSIREYETRYYGHHVGRAAG